MHHEKLRRRGSTVQTATSHGTGARVLSVEKARAYATTQRPLRPDGSNFPCCSWKSKRAGQVDVATFSVGWAFYLSDLKQIGLTLAFLTLCSIPLVVYNVVESAAAVQSTDSASYVGYTTLFPTVYASASSLLTDSVNETVHLRIYEVEALYESATLLPPSAEVNWWYLTITIFNTCIIVLFFARLNTGHRQRERLFAHSMTTPTMFTVFVSGLPADATVDSIAAYFSQWGDLAKICLHAVVDAQLMARNKELIEVDEPIVAEWKEREKARLSVPWTAEDAARMATAEEKCTKLRAEIDDRWLDILVDELDIDYEEVAEFSLSKDDSDRLGGRAPSLSPLSTAVGGGGGGGGSEGGEEVGAAGGLTSHGETKMDGQYRLPQVCFVSYMGSDSAQRCLHFFQHEKQGFRESNRVIDHILMWRRRVVTLATCGRRTDWDCCTGNSEVDKSTHAELDDETEEEEAEGGSGGVGGVDDDTGRIVEIIDDEGELIGVDLETSHISYKPLPASWRKKVLVRSAVEPNDVVWEHVQYQGREYRLAHTRNIRWLISVVGLGVVVLCLGALQCTYQFVVWGQHTSTIGDDLLVSIDWLAQFQYLPSTGAALILVAIAAGIGTARFLTFAVFVPQMNGVARYWSRSHWQRANFMWCAVVEFVWFLTTNVTTLGMMLILSATAAGGDVSGVEDASVIAQANVDFWFIIFAMDITLFSLNQLGRIPVWAKRLIGWCTAKTQHELNIAWVQPADTPYWLYKNVVKVALIVGGLGAWAPAVYAGAMCELFVTFWTIRLVLTQYAAKPIMYRSFLGHAASKFYMLVSLVTIVSSLLFVIEASKRDPWMITFTTLLYISLVSLTWLTTKDDVSDWLEKKVWHPLTNRPCNLAHSLWTRIVNGEGEVSSEKVSRPRRDAFDVPLYKSATVEIEEKYAKGEYSTKEFNQLMRAHKMFAEMTTMAEDDKREADSFDKDLAKQHLPQGFFEAEATYGSYAPPGFVGQAKIFTAMGEITREFRLHDKYHDSTDTIDLHAERLLNRLQERREQHERRIDREQLEASSSTLNVSNIVHAIGATGAHALGRPRFTSEGDAASSSTHAMSELEMGVVPLAAPGAMASDSPSSGALSSASSTPRGRPRASSAMRSPRLRRSSVARPPGFSSHSASPRPGRRCANSDGTPMPSFAEEEGDVESDGAIKMGDRVAQLRD